MNFSRLVIAASNTHWILVAIALTLSNVAAAQELSLVEIDAESRVRVDGQLREWGGAPSVRVGRGADASMLLRLGYDARGLYVAADVKDQRMVRSGEYGRSEDALVLTFAMPQGRALRVTEVWLFAGVSGRAGRASIGGVRGALRAIGGSQIVEMSAEGGYSLEAFIPWSAIPGAAAWEREGRLAVRLQDVDQEARPSVVSAPSTAAIDLARPESIPRMAPMGGTHGLLASFRQARGLRGQAQHDLSGDVCGDARPERVVVQDRYLAVMGEGYRDGQYDYFELPVEDASGVLSAELADFTGDSQQELLLKLRQHDSRGSRDLFYVVAFDGTSIRPLFAIETRKETREGAVEVSLNVTRTRRQAPTITVSAQPARGLSAENFQEAAASDAEGILLPWGRFSRRVYRWDGQRLATVSEQANPRYQAPSAQTTQTTQTRQTQTRQSYDPGPQGRARLQALVAAYRDEHGIPASIRPRFVYDRNVVGSPRAMERVLVLGDKILIVGSDVGGREGYFEFGLGVAAEDILALRVADVDADGQVEILVNVRQQIGDVTRGLMLVQSLSPRLQFQRLLAIELYREQGGRWVRAKASYGRGLFRISTGQAQGFTQANWPWSDSLVGEDGVRSLPLPWAESANVGTYRRVGESLQP